MLDPYVGTGGIVLAAAQIGAQVIGGDIDQRVLKWVSRVIRTE